MNKAEWDAMDTWEKHVLIDKHFGRPFVGEVRQDWPEIVGMPPPLPHYTTDLNACALVLEEIEKRKLWIEFEDAFLDEGDEPLACVDARLALRFILRTGPDMMCYCAIKAVSDD